MRITAALAFRRRLSLCLRRGAACANGKSLIGKWVYVDAKGCADTLSSALMGRSLVQYRW